MSVPDEAFVVALSLLPGVGPARMRVLLDLDAPPALWSAVRSGDRRIAAAVARADLTSSWTAASRSIDVEARWHDLRRAGIGVLWRGGAGYPAPLVDDPEPPEVVFTSGDPTCLALRRVAIVGTRRCTRYGRDLAHELGSVLADAGVTVVSGLARGIDAAAHRGALDAAGAPPVAVVGTAIDSPYPRENASLWAEVAAAGLVCGESPPGSPTERWRFPARNRIIAGLSDVVIVVESAEEGGSLYTATQAFDRGRVVLAVPGPIRSPASLGTNRLLADGAHPLCAVDDVLEILGLVAPVPDETAGPPELSPSAHVVLDALGWQAASLDQLASRTALELTAVAPALDELVRHGLVSVRGGWYEQVHRFRPNSGSNGP